MKKGFTLIELLAIIVILAIIALITTPIITGVINDTRQNAFKDDAISLYKAAQNYFSSATLDDDVKLPLLVTFNSKSETNKYLNNSNKKCETNTKRMLEYSGENPDSGNIYIDKEGNIYMAVYSKKARKCATISKGEKEVAITDKSASTCVLNQVAC